VSAPDQTDADGNTWIFDWWSDGGARSHTITTPASSATYTATFRPGSPPPTTTKTFTPAADAYVRSDNASSNYGTRNTLRTDASPDTLSYLRFDVVGIDAPVAEAKLRVFAGSGNSIGYDVRGVTNTTWGETSITYTNRPGVGSVADSSGRVTAGTWTEVDVTSLVTGNGLHSLALTSASATATSLDSRESANDPELVVTYGSGSAVR
jgi:hypothetical protein